MPQASIEEAKKLALECGFSHVGDLNVDTIKLRTEVRDACAENKCRSYGVNWACPPGCGTLEECDAQLRNYQKGIIVQTTALLESTMDWDGIMELGQNHGEHFKAFVKELRKMYPDSLILGSGNCQNCESCTYPDEPCRFPNLKSSSMEAFGMIVSDVCRDNDIPYYYGTNTLTYVGCALLE